MRNLKRLVPSLADVGVQRTWADRIDATPDAVPVIGEAPGVRGFLIGTGFSGHGFALGPGAGFLLAELVLDGRTSVDIHPLRYSRFEENDMADYSLTI
jgi:glycine/D-amino acid oxidase-like deaminating enzyme